MAASADSATYALAVEVSVPPEAVENGRDFAVETTLRNGGASEVRLWVWSCSYEEHWTVGQLAHNDVVATVPTPCFKNVLWEVALGAGETYRRTLTLRTLLPPTRAHGVGERVTFRLGFQPRTKAGPADTPRIWSGPLAVEVKGF